MLMDFASKFVGFYARHIMIISITAMDFLMSYEFIKFHRTTILGF
jgi:hypothetical protein